jgi:hypothetical protein
MASSAAVPALCIPDPVIIIIIFRFIFFGGFVRALILIVTLLPTSPTRPSLLRRIVIVAHLRCWLVENLVLECQGCVLVNIN